MKKNYLMAFSLILAGSLSAQTINTEKGNNHTINENYGKAIPTLSAVQRAPGDIIAQDDFSGGFANWSTSNLGSGVQGVWETGQVPGTVPADIDDYMGYLESGSPSNGIAYFNGVQYLIAGSVDAQDAALTWSGATINTTGSNNVTLEFAHRYRAFNYDDVFVEVSNDGTNWTSYQVNPNQAGNGPAVDEYERFEISSVAANQADVRVRFRWVETASGGDNNFGSGYGWEVDDFKIIESWNNDLQVNDAWSFFGSLALDYHFIPEAFLTSGGITYAGTFENKGAATQNNAVLKADVSMGGSSVFTGSSATGNNLAPAATDSVGLTSTFTPSGGVGTYSATIWADADETEEVTDNDTTYIDVDITDNIYSRDDANIVGSISHVSSAPEGDLKIGNVMEMPVDGTFGRVQLGIGSSSMAGQIVFVEIRKYNSTTQEYDYVTQSADYTLTSNDLGGLINIDIPQTDFQAGDELLVLACHYGGVDAPFFYYTQTVQAGTVLGYQAGTIFQLLDPGAIIVRLDVRDFTGIEEENSAFNVGQNVPNPFNNTSYINYSIDEASDVTFSVVDMTGKVVMNVDEGTKAAGDYRMNLNANNFAEGVYFYTFTFGDKKVTKKMVITK